MSFLLGNTVIGTFVSGASAPVTSTFAVTGFSHSGGDRPEIDITTSTNNRRKTIPGLASNEEMTLSVKYLITETTALPPIETGDVGADLRAAIVECKYGFLTIGIKKSSDCAAALTRTYLAEAVPDTETIITAAVDVTSWNFSVELDGIMEGEITFRVRH